MARVSTFSAARLSVVKRAKNITVREDPASDDARERERFSSRLGATDDATMRRTSTSTRHNAA
jgi:hypothetical protein